jgi:hypothetical protein
MNLSRAAVLARKVHRILVWFITILGLVMMATGLSMHEAEEGTTLIPILDQGFLRTTHNSLSSLFSLILGLMILTGFYMYIYPWLQKITKKPFS